MRTPLTLISVLAAGAVLPAQSGWLDLTGTAAPPIVAEHWLNTANERPSAGALKGKVWLLEFFATT